MSRRNRTRGGRTAPTVHVDGRTVETMCPAPGARTRPWRLLMSSRLGVAVLALIALANVARADPGRPFVGALESTATTFSVTPEGLLHFEGTVAGRATLTGPITGTFAYDVNPADGTFAGTLTKVAANGDELHEAFVGRFNADFTA